MTVESIMTRDVTVLRPTDKVSDGLRTMHDQHVRTLAVVDDNNEFVGLFGIRQVVHLLLPKAAQIEYGLTDLSFMPDDLGELYHRLREVGDQPVADFLESRDDLLVCAPSTSLPEVLELLHLSFNTSLPVLVLDDDSNRLVGIVSGWDVLEKLAMNVFNDRTADAH
jgi:CBS domain-containing protein